MKNILVVGGAGYIGSHTCKTLMKNGYRVIIFDNLSTGFKELAKYGEFVFGDLNDSESIKTVFEAFDIDTVIHFAASAYVGESVENPKKYYMNNVVNTLNLLNAMLQYDVKKIVFSSTCAVFGDPKFLPMDERHPKSPINPYGRTKLMIEQILEDYDKAYGLKSIVLRYFNAAGSDEDCELAEMHDPEPHLIPIIFEVIEGKREFLEVYGDDYSTKDGTCIRDYIHVEDLADAHLKALEYLNRDLVSDDFNLGTGTGVSILELIEAVESLSKKRVPYRFEDPRKGDPSVLIADSKKAKAVLKWEAKKSDIIEILKSVIEYKKRRWSAE
ncbi:UDP-glucose 4-epimerase GalE [Sulfurimonas sp. HSL-1716]|uniref:UDP-glucose 4-epimerase GalE n=1 Tax=Hydrocurvibacter sulfurireducens TaxID=3131937 RepID=UPI0031F8CA8F